MKKILALVLAVMVLAASLTVAMAQTEGTAADGKGSITISNAAKGETYSVVKIFGATLTNDATATTDASGIAYTGTIPEALESYFEYDAVGNVIKKADADNDALVAAVQAYAKTQSATASAVSDGSKLTFEGLDYGYYAVISTQGATVTVDSLRPNATVYDQNSKTITVGKTVDKETYSIGDTITYTGTFVTVNYLGEGEDAKQVINYEIQDTLPEFLTDVHVTSIIVDEDANLETTDDQHDVTAQFSAKKISIPWATEDAGSNPKTYTNKYKNGAKMVIVYTAKLTSVTNINTVDTNTISLHPTTWNGTTEEKPWDENWQDDAEIKTYAAALKKTDGTNPLPGAQFTIKGLTVTGTAGEYTVVSYNPADDAAESAVLDTNADGKLYIVGLASNVSLTVTEYKAPDGYNRLTNPVTVPAQLLTTDIYTTSGERYYDAKGNVVSESSSTTTTRTVEKNLTDLDPTAVEVVNNKGTELPSTGGVGTTIFYVAGSILVLAAVIFLVTKRRMGNED